MRAMDLAAVALVLGAGLLVVEATWSPPTISTADAGLHIGHHVRIVAFALDARDFGDGGQVSLVADGAALHARYDGTPPDGWIQAQGLVDRDQGRPLLRIVDWQPMPIEPRPTTLAMIATDPRAYVDRAVTVAGEVQGHRLTAQGTTLRLVGDVDQGWHELTGLLRYDPTCLCHVLHT